MFWYRLDRGFWAYRSQRPGGDFGRCQLAVSGATLSWEIQTEEKIRIVLEGFRRETTVNDLCRREGIKPHSYYAWTKEFMEAGKERLTRDSVRDATRQEIEQLKRENSELKQLVGELSLELHRFKKTALPPLHDNGTGA